MKVVNMDQLEISSNIIPHSSINQFTLEIHLAKEKDQDKSYFMLLKMFRNIQFCLHRTSCTSISPKNAKTICMENFMQRGVKITSLPRPNIIKALLSCFTIKITHYHEWKICFIILRKMCLQSQSFETPSKYNTYSCSKSSMNA